jgi:hypothetical protein
MIPNALKMGMIPNIRTVTRGLEHPIDPPERSDDQISRA